MCKGTVFDIKEFSIHDGPGGRVTVFLKGCPLRCIWCHNPEGLSNVRQLMHKESLCTHCGACQTGCDHPECRGFDRCIHACPNGANSVCGYEITADALAGKMISYAELFSMTGGGVTFSGGEPLLQGEFVCAVSDRLPGIHKAIQTGGYADPATYQKVISRMDYVMQDIKLADPTAHKQYTGVSNEVILQNIAWLKKSGIAHVFRIPLIPGITDTKENLTAIAKIVEGSEVELLSYNTMAGAKYPMLGMTYELSTVENRAEDYLHYFPHARVG